MSTLTLNNLHVETADKTPVVKGVSLSIRSSEVHVIMGRNGSGKSSLVNALMGHPKYTITSGTVMLDDENLLTLPPEKRARLGLFLSPQHTPRIEGVTLIRFLHRAYTALTGENMPIMDFHDYATGVTKRLGLSGKLLKRPLDATLSGGEKKHTEIIQLHLLKPRFAFLDEIDSAVDTATLDSVFASVRELRTAGMAITLITHRVEILDRLAPDVVHVMSGGHIKETGTADMINKIIGKGF